DFHVTGVQTCALPIYTLVKSIHVGSVVLSGAGFALRGLWMLSGSELLRHRVTRIVPHVVDTVLLAPAIVLVMMSGQYPTTFPWRSEERRVGKECRSRW